MKKSILTIAKYTCIETIRNRLLALLIIAAVSIFGLVEFIGELAITETRQIQVSFLAYMLRFVAVLITALYVVSSVQRDINDKTINLIIALPIPRYSYYIGKLAGFSVLALSISVLASIPLLLYADSLQVALWTFSLFSELLIIVALCLFFIITLENMPLTLTAVAAFYLLSRSISTIILIGQSPLLETTDFSQKFINFILECIAYLLPQFENFTRTDWLVYTTGSAQNLYFIILQTLIYLVLLSAVSLFDLYRKNF